MPMICINVLKRTVIQMPTAAMLKDVVLLHGLYKPGDDKRAHVVSVLNSRKQYIAINGPKASLLHVFSFM